MGPAIKSEVETFAQEVFEREQLCGWQVAWTKCNAGLCQRKVKTILLPERIIGIYKWEAKEYVLHEVAHIRTEADNMHGTEFFAEFARLVQRFMAKEGRDKYEQVLRIIERNIKAGVVNLFWVRDFIAESLNKQEEK